MFILISSTENQFDYWGELNVTDARNKAYFEKNMQRLRDRILLLKRAISGVHSETFNKTIEILRGENLKLKN